MTYRPIKASMAGIDDDDAEVGGWLQDLGRGAQNVFRHASASAGATGPRRTWDVGQYERFVRELERRLRNIDKNVKKLQKAKRDYKRACGRDKAAIQAELTTTKAELASTKTELQRAQTLAASRGVPPSASTRPRPVPPSQRRRIPSNRRSFPAQRRRAPVYDEPEEAEEAPTSADWSQVEPGGSEAFSQFGERTAISGDLLVETSDGMRAAVMPLSEGLYIVGEMPENVVQTVTSAEVRDAITSEALDALAGRDSFSGGWVGRFKQ